MLLGAERQDIEPLNEELVEEEDKLMKELVAKRRECAAKIS